MSEQRTVASYVDVHPRFARAVTVDDDRSLAGSLQDYVLTPRAAEVLGRVANGATVDTASRAFSIIGPYGSGKSSLGVVLSAILGPEGDDTQDGRNALTARQIVFDADTKLAERFALVDDQHDTPYGWIRAVTTAPEREPVADTVLRALHHGAVEHADVPKRLVTHITALRGAADDPTAPSPAADDIIDAVLQLGEVAPVLLLVDEFGKNLEAFADNSRSSDLYLLQKLAETAANRPDDITLVVVTIQHMAFEAYAETASSAQRREWAKVQGRFEDIPYVDSATGTRRLIASALLCSPEANSRYGKQMGRVQDTVRRLGLPLNADEDVADTFPLHPVTLVALPPLCTRFGQNERTLFSFLASAEPLALPALMAATDADDLTAPWVRPHTLYDYFVESASTLAGAARDATRWAEIVTTVRDAATLTDAQLIVLKTIGVLNLVASYGTLRASSEMLQFACAGAHPDLHDDECVLEALDALTDLGIVVFRDFADEYRIWRGSDFDLAEALSFQRQTAASRPLADLLAQAHSLRPVVAGRHAVHTLTPRSFRQVWANGTLTDDLHAALRDPRPNDGLLLLVTCDRISDDIRDAAASTPFPCVAVVPDDTDPLRGAALEVVALEGVAASEELEDDDLAVRKELRERLDYARQALRRIIDTTYAEEATWVRIGGSSDETLPPAQTTAPLSDVLDDAYRHAPQIRYEAINRHELTSQGARIRTNLLRMLCDPQQRGKPLKGFEDASAESSAYEALFIHAGVDVDRDNITIGADHTAGPDCDVCLDHVNCEVRDEWADAWDACWDGLLRWLHDTAHEPTPVDELLAYLAAPPYGLREGVATVMTATALAAQPDRFMLYEHGTFVRELDDSALERMCRNPADFAVAAPALLTKSGNRANNKLTRALEHLSDALDAQRVPGAGVPTTIVAVAGRVASVLHTRADRYTATTTSFPASPDSERPDESEAAAVVSVREAIATARDPYRLLFHDLPAALGYDHIQAGRGGLSDEQIEQFASDAADAVGHLWRAYDNLVSHVATAINRAATDGDRLLPTLQIAKDFPDAAPDSDAPSADVPLKVRTMVISARSLADKIDQLQTNGTPDRIQPAIRGWLLKVSAGLVGSPIDQWRDNDVGPHTQQMAAVARDMRYLADLQRLGSREDGTTAYAVRIMADSDREHARVVVHHQDRMSHLDGILDHTLQQIDADDPDVAYDLLLAALARRMTT